MLKFVSAQQTCRIGTFERLEKKAAKLQQHVNDFQTEIDQLKLATNEKIKQLENESIAHQSRIQQLESENLQLKREIKKYTNWTFTGPRKSRDLESYISAKEQLKRKFL